MKELLLLGNEAVARGAYEAGVKVASAYPGTPSTEITESIAKYDEIYAEWSPNEKVAVEVAIGAAIAGARSIVCMKHVGLNVAADPVFTAAYTGINAGLVIVVADDPGMHSSQNEQDSRFYAKATHIPMLEPSNSQEAKDFTKLAFELSEKFDTPVILRLTTRISHSRSPVVVGDRIDLDLKKYVKNVTKFVMMPANAKIRRKDLVARENSLKDYAENSEINKIELNDRSVGIISSGITYNYAKEAMPNASFLKLGMVYPLPDGLIKSFAGMVEKLYVVEELETIFEEYIKGIGIEVKGKEVFPKIGELSYEIIAKQLKADGITCGIDNSYENHLNLNDVKQIPSRPPGLCPGCPHRGAFYVFHKLGLNVMGDIGCYTLGSLPPFSSIDTCVCMGASIGNAFGAEKARGREFAKKSVAVIGDSTFIHSGITGLINVVYNKGTTTVVILDNSTTGMTGHQDHPATGRTAKGEPTYMLSLEKLCEAVGVNRVRVEDPLDIKAFENALKEELEADEPSVIIARRPCALLKQERKKEKTPYKIDQDKCKKCGLCTKIGCSAIIKQDKYSIDQTVCNGCGICAQICPAKSISIK